MTSPLSTIGARSVPVYSMLRFAAGTRCSRGGSSPERTVSLLCEAYSLPGRMELEIRTHPGFLRRRTTWVALVQAF